MLATGQDTQTILFADIAGSTRLYEQLGDAQARMLIAHCIEKLIMLTLSRQGKVIKTIGDEVMCTFDLPDHAVAAAFLMQEQTAADHTLAEHRMQLRIGLHHGPVIQEDADVYGDAVNIAARMVEHAKAGQIITSDSTVHALGKKYQSTARMVEHFRIRGKFKPVHLYELSWGHPEELTMITKVNGQKEGSNSKIALHLHFIDSVRVVDKEHPVVTLGRDASNDIVFNDPKVSRLHARIELRKDKFVLVDQSTNGTHVMRHDGQTALLRWDEVQLTHQGALGLGEKTTSDSFLIIRYTVQQ
jgi:adenylate cyclase